MLDPMKTCGGNNNPRADGTGLSACMRDRTPNFSAASKSAPYQSVRNCDADHWAEHDPENLSALSRLLRPSGVVGPWDLAPSARADSDLREVVILRVGFVEVGRFVANSGEEVIGMR